MLGLIDFIYHYIPFVNQITNVVDHFKKLWRSRVDFQIRDSSFPIIKVFSILIDIFFLPEAYIFFLKKRRSSPEHSGELPALINILF
jgi:hypothetical protein